jgi:hypothetical protein
VKKETDNSQATPGFEGFSTKDLYLQILYHLQELRREMKILKKDFEGLYVYLLLQKKDN